MADGSKHTNMSMLLMSIQLFFFDLLRALQTNCSTSQAAPTLTITKSAGEDNEFRSTSTGNFSTFTPKASRTHRAQLSERSRAVNNRYLSRQRPTNAQVSDQSVSKAITNKSQVNDEARFKAMINQCSKQRPVKLQVDND